MSEKQPLFQNQGPAYPPPNPAGPPPPAYPPDYNQSFTQYGHNPPPQQHHNQTTVVVTQPAPVVYVRRYGSGDHFLALSIVLTFLCFFFGTWPSLICTIPAIFVAISAQQAESRGNIAGMEQNHRMALYLNIGACVTFGIFWTMCVVIISVDAA